MSASILPTGSAFTTSAEPSKYSAVLWQKIEFARPLLRKSSGLFWEHEHLDRMFPQFMTALYKIVCGGLAVMHEAAARCRELSQADPVARLVGEYFERHIQEEQDHGAWLLQDMRDSGMDTTVAESGIVSGIVAALLGAQSYWVRYEHPVAFLGYIAAIEGDPPTRLHLDEIQGATSYPPEAFRCLREHSDLDVAHVEDLKSLIDSLPLTPRQQQLIALSSFETIEGLSRLFEELLVSGMERRP